MKSFFKNAVDEIVRRRIDQIEMEMTQNPAHNSTAYAQELAVEAYKQGFRDGVQAYQALIVK